VSGGKAVTMKNYMDVEDSGQNLEVGSQWSEDRDSHVGAAFSRDLTISTIRTSLTTYRLLELGFKMRFQLLYFFFLTPDNLRFGAWNLIFYSAPSSQSAAQRFSLFAKIETVERPSSGRQPPHRRRPNRFGSRFPSPTNARLNPRPISRLHAAY